MADQRYQFMAVPDYQEICDPESWTVFRDSGGTSWAGMIRAVLEIGPEQHTDELKLGPVDRSLTVQDFKYIETLSCEASLATAVETCEKVCDSIDLSITPRVSEWVASLVGVANPMLGAIAKMVDGVKIEFKQQNETTWTQRLNRTESIKATRELTVPESVNGTYKVHPEYRRVFRDVGLHHFDYLFVKRRLLGSLDCFPQKSQASRDIRRRYSVGNPTKFRPNQNEFFVGQQLGRVSYYQPTSGLHCIRADEAENWGCLTPVQLSEMSYTTQDGMMPSLPVVLPGLYEVVKRRELKEGLKIVTTTHF